MVRRRMSCKICGLFVVFWTAFSGIRAGVLLVYIHIDGGYMGSSWAFSQMCGALKLFSE